MKLESITEEMLAARREEERKLFPGSYYGVPSTLKVGLDIELEAALNAKSEEAIQIVLTANPYLLQYAIPNSGHHGIWAFPKSKIRTQKVDGTSGLIPDYLIVAKNSLGYTWHIIELKRWDTQFSNAKGDSLSSDGIRAIVQCATYHAHFEQYIETVRSNVGVSEIIQPKSIIAIIGDSSNETDAQRARRDEFCQLAPKLQIVSYDRLRRGLAQDLGVRRAVASPT